MSISALVVVGYGTASKRDELPSSIEEVGLWENSGEPQAGSGDEYQRSEHNISRDRISVNRDDDWSGKEIRLGDRCNGDGNVFALVILFRGVLDIISSIRTSDQAASVQTGNRDDEFQACRRGGNAHSSRFDWVPIDIRIQDLPLEF